MSFTNEIQAPAHFCSVDMAGQRGQKWLRRTVPKLRRASRNRLLGMKSANGWANEAKYASW